MDIAKDEIDDKPVDDHVGSVEVELEGAAEVNADDNPNVADTMSATSDIDEGAVEDDAAKIKADKAKDKQEYGTKVKKRIDKLTVRMREAEDREAEAVKYAQGMQKEMQQLKQQRVTQDGAFANEQKSRIEAQLDTANRQHNEAYQTGDPELISKATAAMSRANSELLNAEHNANHFQRRAEEFTKAPAPAEYQPNAQRSAQNPAPQIAPDTKAEEWAEKNEWFGDDEAMTGAAMSIHNRMVTEEGYLPTEDAYYTELDHRLRKNFPTKFEKAPRRQTQTTQVVTGGNAPAGAGVKRANKKVTLSQSQVSIARKLGVPLEEYAKYV